MRMRGSKEKKCHFFIILFTESVVSYHHDSPNAHAQEKVRVLFKTQRTFSESRIPSKIE